MRPLLHPMPIENCCEDADVFNSPEAPQRRHTETAEFRSTFYPDAVLGVGCGYSVIRPLLHPRPIENCCEDADVFNSPGAPQRRHTKSAEFRSTFDPDAVLGVGCGHTIRRP